MFRNWETNGKFISCKQPNQDDSCFQYPTDQDIAQRTSFDQSWLWMLWLE